MKKSSERGRIELLEARRMLEANLHAYPITFGLPNVVLPGGTFAVKIDVYNHGDAAVAQSFAVAARLVPISMQQWVGQTFTFDSAQFVEGGSAMHSGTIAPSGFAQLQVNVAVPVDIEAGLYALVVKADVTNNVAESSDSDNAGIAIAIAVLSGGGVMALRFSEEGEWVRMVEASVDFKRAVRFTGDVSDMTFRTGAVSGFDLQLLGGDDIFIVDGVFSGLSIDGGDGNDRIAGNFGNETLVGGAGKDVLDGGLGNDRLKGNGGNDKLLGNAGADRLYGYAGNDYLDGGSSGDRIDGGAGLDTLLGQSGDDKFFADDGEVDQVFGASGTDSASVDPEDILSSIESPLIVD
jgi:hypothetical protein